MNSNDRAIVSLVMVAHALVHTYELSIPILVAIWLVEFPITASQIGLAVTVGTAFFGLGALPSGVLTDSYGSQRLITLCLLGMGGSFLVLSSAQNLLMITLSLSLWGLAASVYHPAGLSLISKGVSRRGSAFAYHGMAGNLGIAVGPLLTAILLIAFPWRIVVAILAVPAGIGALYAVRISVDESAAVAADGGTEEPTGGDDAESHSTGTGQADASTEHSDADSGESVDNATSDDRHQSVSSLRDFLSTSGTLFASSFIFVFAILILSGLYYRGVTTFLQQILSELPFLATVTLGQVDLQPSRFVYAGLLMVGMAGQYVGGRLTDRVPTERGLAGGFGALAIVGVLFVPASNAGIIPLLVVSALLGFFMFTVQPLYQATVAEYSPPETRGLTYGYTYLGVFGVGALGAAIAGAALTYYSQSGLFFIFAGMAALASLIGVGLSIRGRN